MFVIAPSNVLVQFPINSWATWGAFVYPVGYLISELTNQWAGPAQAPLVAWVGFGVAAVQSSILATPRIASASSSAFLVSQMLDVAVSIGCDVRPGGVLHWLRRWSRQWLRP